MARRAGAAIRKSGEVSRKARADIGRPSGPSPLGLLVGGICVVNDVIDTVFFLFNITGFWEIVIAIIDTITLILIIGWMLMKKGAGGTVKEMLKNYKGLLLRTIIYLIIEFIPILGDIMPGWILTVLGLYKVK